MQLLEQFLRLAMALTLLSGCGTDWPQRLGYHMFQNAGQLQCQKAMANDCERRQSYEQYRRERQQVSE